MPFDVASVLRGGLNAIERPLFSIGAQPISLLWLCQTAGLLLLAAILARGTKRLLKERVLTRFGISEGNREVVAAAAGFSVAAGVSLVVLQEMGLKLENLGLILGGLGIGVGFGLQELTKSLVSGATLLAERKLKVGDLIEFKGKEGHIQEISIRSTVIRTFKGSELVVPNTELANEWVENWTYANTSGRIDLPIQVELDSDPVLVTELLLRAAYLEAAVLAEPAPRVLLVRIGDGAMHFLLWVWVDRIDRSLGVKSALNFSVAHFFRQHGVAFARREPDFRPTAAPERTTTPSANPEAEPAAAPPPGALGSSLRTLLPNLRYFRQFDDLQLRQLIETGSRRHLRHGQILVHQGQELYAFCLVLSGTVEAYYENRRVSQRLFTFREGDYFGELPLLLKIPYPTTMRAVGETSLFLVGAQGFLALLERHADLRQAVVDEAAKRRQEFQLCQDSLRDLGLLDDEHQEGPVAWLRRKLHSLLRNRREPVG